MPTLQQVLFLALKWGTVIQLQFERRATPAAGPARDFNVRDPGLQRAGPEEALPDCLAGVPGPAGPDLGPGHCDLAGRRGQTGAGTQAKEFGEELQADLVEFSQNTDATNTAWWSRMCSAGRWPPKPCPTSGRRQSRRPRRRSSSTW